MNISAVIKKDDNFYQFTTEVTEDQMRFLLEHAIRDLIHRGIIPLVAQENQEIIALSAEEAAKLN